MSSTPKYASDETVKMVKPHVDRRPGTPAEQFERAKRRGSMGVMLALIFLGFATGAVAIWLFGHPDVFHKFGV